MIPSGRRSRLRRGKKRRAALLGYEVHLDNMIYLNNIGEHFKMGYPEHQIPKLCEGGRIVGFIRFSWVGLLRSMLLIC